MKMQFQIAGMHCTACAASIERAVKNLPDVENVYVNFAASLLTLEADQAKVTPDMIIRQVENAGFKAVELSGGSGPRPVPLSDQQDEKKALARCIVALFFSILLFYAAMHGTFHLPYPAAAEPFGGWIQLFLLLPIWFAGKNFFASGVPSS